MGQVNINVFAPGVPHSKQIEFLNDPTRFKVLRAGRKWRKTSLLISWLFEQALLTGGTCPYIAPNRVQAKNISWRDHVARMLDELRRKKVPHKVNEVELAVTFPNGGRVQLMGVENKEALRGISNWTAVGGDEVDDWEEDIWPTIIRPNLIVHKAPAIMAGTPKGMRILYKMSQQPEFKEFHYRSHDNPDLDPDELEALVKEYQAMGEDYYAQEILAEYVKPVGLVYKEWPLENYRPFEYDPSLPIHLTIDFGVNDPTSISWIQPSATEVRLLDYYEATDVSIEHYVSVIKSKPYKTTELNTGDAAGKARSLTTGTSPIEIMASKGIYIKTTDGLKIKDQIRRTHTFIPRLIVNSNKCERFKDCLLNYRYPTMGVEKRSKLNQENEVPIHDQYCVVGETKIRTLQGWKRIDELVGTNFWVWGYSKTEKRLIPARTDKCWLAKKDAEIVEVVLDDRNSLKCTPNHKIMLRDGTYCEAKDLVPGDSIMPFYEWQTGENQHTKINLNDGSNADEHRYVYARLNGNLREGMHVDHIDGNKKNNHPNNLQLLSPDDHCKKTKPHTFTKQTTHGKPVGIRTAAKNCAWCKSKYVGTWKSIYCSKLCGSRKRSMARSEEERLRQPTRECVWCEKEFHAYSRELTCSNKCASERTARYNQDYQKNRVRRNKVNHKVLSVRPAGRADVYDISVPETRNFVAEGIVISNSHALRAFEYWCVNYKETTNNLDKQVAQRMAQIRSSEDWI